MYKLYTKLDKDECIKLLDNSLLDSKFYFGYVGYIGKVHGDTFWASSRTEYRLAPNGISYAPAMNFEAQVSKIFNETVIEGDFKFSKGYNIGFCIWLSVLACFYIFILVLFLNSWLFQDEFNANILIVLALIPLFATVVWLVMYKFNARQCNQANNDTLEFIKALLHIHKIE